MKRPHYEKHSGLRNESSNSSSERSRTTAAYGPSFWTHLDATWYLWVTKTQSFSLVSALNPSLFLFPQHQRGLGCIFLDTIIPNSFLSFVRSSPPPPCCPPNLLRLYHESLKLSASYLPVFSRSVIFLWQSYCFILFFS